VNIVSFLAPRRDHPRWNDIYFDLLEILDRSCRHLGLRHVVLTDDPTLPHGELFYRPLPADLMQAATQAHFEWLAQGNWHNDDTCLVGVDCIVLQDPASALCGKFDMAVTYRDARARYPINTGMIYISANARERARALFKRVADRTGTTWCDDQRAIQAELAPMPDGHGVYERAMMRVGFLPMFLFNERPDGLSPMPGRIMLHFRGKIERKKQMVEWAAKWLK